MLLAYLPSAYHQCRFPPSRPSCPWNRLSHPHLSLPLILFPLLPLFFSCACTSELCGRPGPSHPELCIQNSSFDLCTGQPFPQLPSVTCSSFLPGLKISANQRSEDETRVKESSFFVHSLMLSGPHLPVALGSGGWGGSLKGVGWSLQSYLK